MLYFNPNNTFYKNPAGAVEENVKTVFRVSVSRRDFVKSVYLLLSKDKHEAEKIKMNFEVLKEGKEQYIAEIPPLSNGIYWYTFIVEYKDGEAVFGRGDDGFAAQNISAAFQQTVYKKGWKAAEKFKGKIIYQIFPDRFFKSGETILPERKNYIKKKEVGELPNYKREKNGDLDTTDFFGGNLKGIEEKLDYIKSLGAGVIYLNPIFEAHSNHRYDTSDYSVIDPVLGTEEDFVSLCKAAAKKGIKIILDGVFSHTGDNSVYFNKYNTYPSVGAYQSKESPYYHWYKFKNFPDDYSAWWGIKILPEVDETNPEYLDYITGENGIVKKWLELGAAGWRLDVADELPDEFLDSLYKRVKETKKDAYVVGEVWEDATNKEGFGKRRKYLRGYQMDGVMNYVLKDAVIDYLLYGSAERVANAQTSLSENYPKPSLLCLMNILGSHDTKRILSVLGGYSADDNDFEGQAREKLSEESRDKAIKLLKIGYFLLISLPGCPTVFYGDETGMEGLRDPLNRKYFDWDNIDNDLLSHYRKMGKIRNENKELIEGDYKTLYAKDSLLAFSRGKITAITNCKEEAEFFETQRDMKNLITGRILKKGRHKIGAYSYILLK